MHRRLYFVLPDAGHARAAAADLRAAGLDDAHLHALAREGTDLAGLPPASPRQRIDTLGRAERWLWNANLALFALALAGLAWALAAGAALAVAVALAVMVATVTAGYLFVQRLPHTHLEEFRQALAHGEVLLMVDVPAGRVAEIEALMRRRHPEAVPGGATWTVDALGV